MLAGMSGSSASRRRARSHPLGRAFLKDVLGRMDMQRTRFVCCAPAFFERCRSYASRRSLRRMKNHCFARIGPPDSRVKERCGARSPDATLSFSAPSAARAGNLSIRHVRWSGRPLRSTVTLVQSWFVWSALRAAISLLSAKVSIRALPHQLRAGRCRDRSPRLPQALHDCCGGTRLKRRPVWLGSPGCGRRGLPEWS